MSNWINIKDGTPDVNQLCVTRSAQTVATVGDHQVTLPEVFKVGYGLQDMGMRVVTDWTPLPDPQKEPIDG